MLENALGHNGTSWNTITYQDTAYASHMTPTPSGMQSYRNRGGTMTPHNEAGKHDYAEAVLLPGDPLRAQWIAETFLKDARQVNGIRNCLGFTGT